MLTAGQDKLLRIYDMNKPEAGKHNLYVFMVLFPFNLNAFSLVIHIHLQYSDVGKYENLIHYPLTTVNIFSFWFIFF